jgi:hypothetical protein
MTANQFRAMLAKAKLSQRGAAKLFRHNERTFRRYALGERPVPADIINNLRALIDGKATAEKIEQTYARFRNRWQDDLCG